MNGKKEEGLMPIITILNKILYTCTVDDVKFYFKMIRRVNLSAVLIITYRNINHLQDTLQNYKSGLVAKSGKNLVTNVWPLRITTMLLTQEAMCVCL